MCSQVFEDFAKKLHHMELSGGGDRASPQLLANHMQRTHSPLHTHAKLQERHTIGEGWGRGERGCGILQNRSSPASRN